MTCKHLLFALTLCASSAAHAASPAAATSAPAVKPRVIVLTDIGSDADDTESTVRRLLYANDIDVEGLIATTSTHLRDAVHPELISGVVRAYGEVLPNLRVHSPTYPNAAQIAGLVRAGLPVYGMASVGKGKDTEASRLIIAAVDRPDPRPVWISIWGGAKELAQALWTVRATRSPAQVQAFVAKLRVYSISDQDDAGPWARMMFPKLFWITSVHAFSQYEMAAWQGFSTPQPGADQSQVTRQWLTDNIRNKGPLGAAYPQLMFTMEGDSPSFVYLIPNGLGSAEHPDWGSWGGRFGQLADILGLWTDTQDGVIGSDGKFYRSQQATIWRWRSAYQNDFLARMNWSVTPRYQDGNHPPELVLNGISGTAPLMFQGCPGQPIKLSAAGSRDPDGQPLQLRWWIYNDAAGLNAPRVKLSAAEGEQTIATPGPTPMASKLPPTLAFKLHVILEATDAGTPALTRYRRAVIEVPGRGSPEALAKCAAAAKASG